MKSNYTILILGILSILILLIFVQILTAQPQNDDKEDRNWFDDETEENNKDDDDNGWWDPREEYYNYSQSDHSTDLGIDGSLFLIFIISFSIIIYIIWKVTHRTKERRYFSSEVKRQVLKNQNYKCAICKRSTGLWDYDHKNGDRSNNKLSNCQALCPNCHAKKTRGLLKTRKSKLSLVKIFVIIVMIIIFFIILFPFLIRNFSMN
jgi:hypothetical protein